VALRIDAADARTLQLLRWRPGTAKLSHGASVRLPRPVQAAAGDDRCLFSRDPGGSVFNAVGGLVETIAFRWPLDRAGMEGFAGVGLTNSPIDYWTDVVDLALDGNTQAVLLDEQGGVRRQPDFDRKPVPPSRGSGVSILAPNAAWGARLVPLEDPVVPLLKSTRIDIVDTGDGTVARSLADHTGAAAFTPDGESIATVSGQRIRLWDRRDGRERLRMQTASTVAHLAFDASSRQLAASGSDGSLEVFAIGAADEVARIADGQRVTVIDAPVRHVVVSGKRLLWPAAAGGLPSVFPLDGYVQRLTASPDGRFLVVGVTAEQPIVMFGDPPGMTLLLITAAGGDHEVRYSGPWGDYRFDHAASRLVVQGRDGKVRLIDTSEGRVLWNREVEPMREPPAAPLTGWHAPLAIADDGSVSAVSTSEGLAVLDNDSGEVLLSEKNWNGALALSSDGALLAHSQSEGGIAVVRVRDGSRVAQFDAREAGGVRDLIFSPGGALLMSIGGTSFSTFMSGGHFSEEHVIAWSLADGARVARIPESAQALSDYQEQLGPRGDDAQQLTGVVWNTSAREFAGTMFPSLLAYWTVPSDMVRSTLAAWRLEDTGIVEIYRAGAEDSATTGAFAAAAGMLIHGDDGVQRVVDLRRSSVVAAACRSIPRSLTNEERRAALGGGLRSPLRCPVSHP
jgi:WD40 repeat protein